MCVIEPTLESEWSLEAVRVFKERAIGDALSELLRHQAGPKKDGLWQRLQNRSA